MINSPLPKGIKYVEGLPRSEEYLINLLYADGNIISRPGITEYTAGIGPCRGRFVFNDRLYHVSGDRLIRINTGDGSITDIGEILGDADIDSAVGFTHAVIVVKGGAGYVLQVDETLTEITDPDFVPMDEVTRVNGRFVFCPSDGSPVFYSDIGNGGSIGALSFFDAEVSTDKNVGVANYRNDLYVLGENTIQLFRDVGPDTNPFVPVTGATANQGYIAAKIEYGGQLWFVGRENNQAAGIFAMAQGEAVRMSNPAIDRIIQSLSLDELRGVRSQRIVWRGHDFIEFKFPEYSFCFYRGNWTYFQSITHIEEFANWQPRHSVYFEGQYFVGSDDGRIGVISENNADFDEPIRRVIKTFVRSQGDSAFGLSSVSLAVTQGKNLNPGSVGLRVSDDGALWSSRFFMDLDQSGDHTFRVHWEFPGGLGYYRNGYCGVEFYTTSEVVFAVDGLSYYEQ